MQFINHEYGILLSSSKGFLTTNDGGKRWFSLKSRLPGNVVSFSFSNIDRGFALGVNHGLYHLYRTVDGARSWTAIPLPSEMNGVQPTTASVVASAHSVWVTANWDNGKSGIYMSDNNGYVWNTEPNVNLPNPAYVSMQSVFSDNAAQLISSCNACSPISKLGTSGMSSIITTVDSGKNWSYKPIPIRTDRISHFP